MIILPSLSPPLHYDVLGGGSCSGTIPQNSDTERFRRSSRAALLFFGRKDQGRFFSSRSARDVTSNPPSNEPDGTCPVVNSSNPSNGSLTTRSPGHGTDTELREGLNRTIGSPRGVVGGTGQNPDHSSAKANDRHP